MRRSKEGVKMIDAIILAGGQKKGLFLENQNYIDEALLSIAGRHMIEYVVKALKDSKHVNNIIIAGSIINLSPLYGKDNNILLVDKGETTVRSLYNALMHVEDTVDFVLVVTVDVPLITAEAIDDFVEVCMKKNGDLFYPIVSKERNDSDYPGIKRTYVSLKDGVFTGGNAIFVRPKLINQYIVELERIVALRKKPLSIASYVGWGLMLKLIFGILSIDDIEKRLARLYNIKCVGIISKYPEIGIDVDKHSDLDYIERLMSS